MFSVSSVTVAFRASGAWALDGNANESQKGFLLNHLISEELPGGDGEHRFSNSDPVTGQAAWYDVRVRVYKADDDEPQQTWPQFDTQPRVPGMEAARGRWQAFVRGITR